MSLSRLLADLGKSIDSATAGHFLTKGDSAGQFETVVWADISDGPTFIDSASTLALIDSAYIQARQTSSGSGSGLDSAAISAIIDSDYISARTSSVSAGFKKYQYTATASQTTFQDSDVNGNILSYDADYILVHYNGVLLPSADYTATDGSSVVLGTGADSGSIIAIAKWGTGSVSSSGGGSWYGDRGIIVQGYYGYSISQVDITTLGNATDFGDATQHQAFWSYMAGVSNNTYGLYGGGAISSGYADTVEYITIATAGNGTDFGDLTVARTAAWSATNGIIGLWAGGKTASTNYETTIDYVTIATPGNASDVGDLYEGGGYGHSETVGDGTYGIFGGGIFAPNRASIQYMTIATSGNASDFGDTTISNYAYSSGCSDLTYGLFPGTGTSPYNQIDYVTIATPGNASDFGDLNVGHRRGAACANATRGIVTGGMSADAGSTAIDYVTIATPGNASDFGDTQVQEMYSTAMSGSPS